MTYPLTHCSKGKGYRYLYTLARGSNLKILITGEPNAAFEFDVCKIFHRATFVRVLSYSIVVRAAFTLLTVQSVADNLRRSLHLPLVGSLCEDRAVYPHIPTQRDSKGFFHMWTSTKSLERRALTDLKPSEWDRYGHDWLA